MIIREYSEDETFTYAHMYKSLVGVRWRVDERMSGGGRRGGVDGWRV